MGLRHQNALGPVLCFIAYDTEDEAIRIANDSVKASISAPSAGNTLCSFLLNSSRRLSLALAFSAAVPELIGETVNSIALRASASFGVFSALEGHGPLESPSVQPFGEANLGGVALRFAHLPDATLLVRLVSCSHKSGPVAQMDRASVS